MDKKQARCPKCDAILMEREQFCRNCQESVNRKDKEHEPVTVPG